MRSLLAVTALALSVQSHADTTLENQFYDVSPAIINSAPERSEYYLHKYTWTEGMGTTQDVPLARFLQEADRKEPVVIAVHGCATGAGEETLKSHFMYNGVNVVVVNFIKRGVRPSCLRYPVKGGWPEVSNPKRIKARRMELEAQVQFLKDNGFQRIWVAGHSEGGRVAMGLKAEVSGVMIFGMGCHYRQFWSPNPRNPHYVFLSRKDDWLGWPDHKIVGCRTLFNSSYVAEYWSDIPSHDVLLEAEHRDITVRLVKGTGAGQLAE